MKYTSAEAAKLLRKLNEERSAILEKEQKTSVFLAAMGEDVESVRPLYDYAGIQEKLDQLDLTIRNLKHAINRFNVSYTVPGFNMSIDQLLVYIPQLSARKQKLSGMKDRLPKQRESTDRFGHTSTIIDYSYANYDISTAEKEYAAVSDELSRAQTALDVANNTETLEVTL